MRSTRWLMLLLCFVGVFINYMDRTNFSIAAPLMSKELGLSPRDIGLLFGVFFAIYTLAVIPIGGLIDRFGPRLTYAGSLVTWSIASACTGMGAGIVSLCGARSLMGAGEASCFPVNSKVVAQWFPRTQRATATSFWHVGIGLSSAASIPLIGYLIMHTGWRLSFVVTGAVGIVFALVWFMVYRDPVGAEIQRDELTGDTGAARASIPWRILIRHRTVWGLALGFFCANTVNSFFMGWFPSYLMHERHFTLAEVTTVGALPAVSALCGGLLAGFTADAMYRRGFALSTARKTCLVGGLVAASTVAFAVLVDSVTVSFALFSLAYAGIAFTSASLQALPAEVSPSRAEVGAVAAIQTAGGAFAGLVGNWLVGLFIELAGGSYVTTVMGIGVFALIAAVVYLFIVGPIRPLTRAELGLAAVAVPATASRIA